jgi:hypothetical protein
VNSAFGLPLYHFTLWVTTLGNTALVLMIDDGWRSARMVGIMPWRLALEILWREIDDILLPPAAPEAVAIIA